MTTTTLRDLRANMKTYFDSLDDNKDVLIVPRQGDKDAIVIMTLSEYNSLTETEYLLSTESNRREIEKALNELKTGEVTQFNIEE